MLYRLAHIIKDKCPIIWTVLDVINSILFRLRYGKKLRNVESAVLDHYSEDCGVKIVNMNKLSISELTKFFDCQPKESFTYFNPHGFDGMSLEKLQKNNSFLAYVILDEGEIAAYCFIRAFFHGKGFRGRMVGIDYRGRGLGTMMNRMMNDIGFGIGLRLFETVSEKNVASYRSTISSSNFKVLKKLNDHELYLEILANK